MLLRHWKLDTNKCNLKMRAVSAVSAVSAAGKVCDFQGPLGSSQAITILIVYNQYNVSGRRAERPATFSRSL